MMKKALALALTVPNDPDVAFVYRVGPVDAKVACSCENFPKFFLVASDGGYSQDFEDADTLMQWLSDRSATLTGTEPVTEDFFAPWM